MTRAINEGEIIVTTGLVLQELLQGFIGPRARRSIMSGLPRFRCFCRIVGIKSTLPSCEIDVDVPEFSSEQSMPCCLNFVSVTA